MPLTLASQYSPPPTSASDGASMTPQRTDGSSRSRSDLVLAARVDAPRETYAFETMDGVHSPDEFRTSELLLLEVLWDERPAALGSVQGNWGVPGLVLADVADRVHVVDNHARAVKCCRRNAHLNDVASTVTVDCARTPGDLDDFGVPDKGTGDSDGFAALDAVAYAPRPYAPLAQGRRRLADALRALAPDGTLYLAATPEAGLTRYRSTLEALDAAPRSVRSQGNCTVVAADRPRRVPPTEFVEPSTRHEHVAGVDLALVSEPGVFAAGGLDHGTRLLLENATVDDGDSVLDCCCGAGAIGAWAAASVDCDVTLTDVDAVATTCARRTLAETGIAVGVGATATVHTADCLDAVRDERFDHVLANPPTHAGEEVLAELLDGAHGLLAPDGELRLVHHHALDLDPHLRRYSSVETVATGDEHVVRVAQS